MAKSITITLPEFLTIGQYQHISSVSTKSKVERLVETVHALTDYSVDEIQNWPISTLSQIGNDVLHIADAKSEFHSLIEFKGEVYGYAHMRNATLGEYISLEKLSQDVDKNLHKIAAILYRPVKNNRFDSIRYALKSGVRTVINKVDDVFGWYDVERYDSKTVNQRHEMMKDFPVHIILGALSFFLATANLYLTDILYSNKEISTEMKNQMNQVTNQLLANIGDGSALYTRFPKLTSSLSRVTLPSLN